jgi:hypothetical protein
MISPHRINSPPPPEPVDTVVEEPTPLLERLGIRREDGRLSPWWPGTISVLLLIAVPLGAGYANSGWSGAWVAFALTWGTIAIVALIAWLLVATVP